MLTQPTLTQLTNNPYIEYTHPTLFTLISHNLIPTNSNPHLSITISPTTQQSPLHYHSLSLSPPSKLLSTNQFSTITTEHHSPLYASPLPLKIYNPYPTKLQPPQYSSIPLNSTISIQITEILISNNLSTQFYLTHIHLH